MIFDASIVPITLFILALVAVGASLIILGTVAGPRRPNPIKAMPYESGVDPFHDARRRLNIRYHLLAVAFLIFDVELLFLYPWAVALRQTPRDGGAARARAANSQDAKPVADGISAPAEKTTEPLAAASEPVVAREVSTRRASVPPGVSTSGRTLVFWGGVLFLAILTLGFVYDWRKGVFRS